MRTGMRELIVVDKPGTSSGCACGGAADPRLPRFAGDLEPLRGRRIDVHHIDPRGTSKHWQTTPRRRHV
jgi:hypothetical protein